MNLIFNEYIEFLKSKTDIPGLKQWYFWLDKQIIKYFNSNFEICKYARIYVSDNLEVSYKLYNNSDLDIVNIDKVIEHYSDRLKQLEEESIELIKSKYKDKEKVILSSTGKDSMVVTHLVRKVYPNALVVFNNTSMDVACTYKMAKSIDNCIILSPKQGFYNWREENNFIPTRFARACCNIFKEKVFVDNWDKDKETVIYLGMRNEESLNRSTYEYESHNNRWSDKWHGILPIRKWTELDVWLYTIANNIPINDKYKQGYSRVGCGIVCPYYTKSTWVLDKYFYPLQYERWHKILDKDFLENNKDLILNCNRSEYHKCWNGGKYREDADLITILEFAERSGLDYNVATKYFDRTCECGKRIKGKEVSAMNMKFYGRNIDKFKCKKCIMNDLEITENDWNNYIRDFKLQGCKLF